MFRHVFGYLQDWITKKERKPLLVRGARQVGKTWIIRELAQVQGLLLVEINLEQRPEFKSIFKSMVPTEILQSLAFFGLPIQNPAKTLFFIDEIQECPQAITALRYFYEQFPELPLIASGSLLEFAFNAPNFVMPVGRIEFLWMYPMNFCEFLIAKKQDDLANVIQNKSNSLDRGLPPIAHERALKFLREYFFCGGMPEVVKSFTSSSDVNATRNIQLSILQSYRQDFYKYAPRIKPELAEKLFIKLPGLVSSRFKYTHIDSESRANEVNKALQVLEKAGVVHRVVHSSGQALPLLTESNERIAKLFMLDVGLMHAALQIDLQLVQEPDLLAVHRGAVAEQFVAQELIASGAPNYPTQLFFWVREAMNSQAEVDFVVPIGNQIIPIEVKSGSSGTLKSLQIFLDSHKATPFGIRTYTGEFVKEKKLINLPLYSVGAIHQSPYCEFLGSSVP